MEGHIHSLIRQLIEGDDDECSTAHKELVEFGARSVRALLAALEDLPHEDLASDAVSTEGEAAYAIAAVLSDIGEPAVEPLINALDPGHDNSIRCFSAYILSYIADRRAVDTLVDAVDSSNDVELRRCAAVALGSIGDIRALPSLLAALKDPDVQLRAQSAAAFGNIGDKSAVEPLLNLLGDPSEDVRRAAIRSLARLGDSRATEPLIGLLHDKEQQVRCDAAMALGDLGDARAIAPLLQTSSAENDRVLRYHATASLLKLGYSIPLHDSDDYTVDVLALLHLGEISEEEAYRLYDRVMDGISSGTSAPDWAFALGLSEFEARAFAWGVDLQQLLTFRFGGWPTVCSRCKLPIDYRIDNWAVTHDQEVSAGLAHIACLERG